ncbi:MAG: glycerate kinase [Firmicutes bacterium]|nr:glycerate kinase [Bacillota bacterium]
MDIRKDAEQIIRESIRRVLPDEAVARALQDRSFGQGRILVVAAGKAAWRMAAAAARILGNRISGGVVVTKYGHAEAEIPGMACYEGGHPVPDENSFRGTQAALELVRDLSPEDTVLFLLSGGGSALFEKPLIPGEELSDITGQLLACGADIVEINTVRKRLSAVKGGRFAHLCKPAGVFGIVLSDVLEDRPDMIASGPVSPDSSTCSDAMAVIRKYGLRLSEKALECMGRETPKELSNVETVLAGSVGRLCEAAAEECRRLGYETVLLTDRLCCEAKEAGSFLAAIAKSHENTDRSLAFIAGGETVVRLTGKGKGGRNQELALSAARGIAGMEDTAVFSVGSDGTDGPTDAAGGFCDGGTQAVLAAQGVDISENLRQNDAYTALSKCNGLIFTGPTGTNVNDVAVVLIKKRRLRH